MRSSVFQFPFEKVFRSTKGALRHLGLKIVSFDEAHGTIKAVSGFSFLHPSFKVDLEVHEMENHNIKVTVNGLSAKHNFLQKNRDAETSEAEILEKVSKLL